MRVISGTAEEEGAQIPPVERLRFLRRVANIHASQSSKGREEVYELDGRAHDASTALRRPGHSNQERHSNLRRGRVSYKTPRHRADVASMA